MFTEIQNHFCIRRGSHSNAQKQNSRTTEMIEKPQRDRLHFCTLQKKRKEKKKGKENTNKNEIK